MRCLKKYSGHVVFCKLPSLAEAMEHFKETGEFILSARDDDSYDSDSRDFDPFPVDSGEIDIVSVAAGRKVNQDSRGMFRDSKTPESFDSQPSTSDSVPSQPVATDSPSS